MRLFEYGFDGDGAKSLFGRPLVSITGREKNVLEIAEIILEDVEAKGEQQGYEKAARKYEKFFQDLENEYQWTKKVLEAYISGYNARLEVLDVWLEMLKKEEEELKKQIDRREVLEKNYVPFGDGGVLFSDRDGCVVPYPVSVLGTMCCCYKEWKFREAERRGYVRAKELYLEKINGMRQKLDELLEKGDGEIQELIRQMREVLDEIMAERIRVAELAVYCGELDE